jgi:signal transduction histidine kinase
VQLGEDQDRWHLTILDNGTGFDQAQVRAGGAGAGLVNMRDRLYAVGGTVTVGSLSGWGTTVAAVVPKTEDLEPARTPVPVPRKVS